MSVSNSKTSPLFKQCLLTAAVCCSVISSCGCAMGFPGIMLPQLQESGDIKLTDDQASWIASVSTMPMLLGNCIVPTVMSRAGRRAAHFLVILITALSWIIAMLGTNYEALLIGMIIQGAATGMMSPLRSLLIGECTSPRYRGAFLTMNTLAQTVGIFLVHLIGSFISYKITALVSMSFSIVSFLITMYTPETPSWFAMRGQYDKCRESFMWFRRQEDLPELAKLIDANKGLNSIKKHKVEEIFVFVMRKEFYKPIILMSALFCITNFSDGTLLVVYPIPILQALMGPKANAAAWMVVLDAQDLVFTSIAVYVVHKVQRRTLLFTTGVVCLISQLGMAAYMLAVTNGWLSHITWLADFLICLEMACVHIGLLPLCFVVGGEVFPLQFRSYSESISILTCFGPVFLLLKTFPDLMATVGLHGVFGLYAGVIALSLLVAWFLLPETSSLTLQEIEEHFKGTPLSGPRTGEENPLKGIDDLDEGI